jgi:hypothetical protein
MSDVILAMGDEGDEGNDRAEQGSPNHQAKEPRRKILSQGECLEKLSALPGLVAMGLLTTSKANCIRTTISTVLQFNSKQASPDSRREVDSTELAEMLKANPEMAKFLEPFLTREQIKALLNQGSGDGVS